MLPKFNFVSCCCSILTLRQIRNYQEYNYLLMFLYKDIKDLILLLLLLLIVVYVLVGANIKIHT